MVRLVRLIRRGGRWRAIDDDVRLDGDFEQFVASVQETLNRKVPETMNGTDDDATAAELAAVWDRLGLARDTEFEDLDVESTAQPPIAAKAPGPAAYPPMLAAPHGDALTHDRSPGVPAAPTTRSDPASTAQSGGGRGWRQRLMEWLRSPGLLVTAGAVAIASVVTWQIATSPQPLQGQHPFGFGGSAGPEDDGRRRCPPGSEPRSIVRDQGRRAIWCERLTPAGPVRAPWVELDASGRPTLIGQYVNDQREGAFLSIEIDQGVMRMQTMCFSGGKRVEASICDKP